MGPLNRPLRRELEKLFSNPRCPLRPNWPTFLAEIYISSAVKVRSKVSSHEMNPNFWFRQEGERFESQQVGGGGEVARLQNCIQHFCPLFPPNGPPLVILDHWRFSLFEWITRVVAGKMEKVKSVVSAHCKSVASSVWLRWWETTADHHMVTTSPRN